MILLEEQFKKLGLAKYQSLALSMLVLNKSCTAERIAESCGIPITKVYAVLDSLKNLGFVKSDLQRPKNFYAEDIEVIINLLIKKHRENLLVIEKQSREILYNFKEFMNTSTNFDEFHGFEKALKPQQP